MYDYTVIMLDIKEEIEIVLLKKRKSMRKLIEEMRNAGFDIQQSGTMSTQLTKKRIRFQTIQDMLDYLGYELVIREKKD